MLHLHYSERGLSEIPCFSLLPLSFGYHVVVLQCSLVEGREKEGGGFPASGGTDNQHHVCSFAWANREKEGRCRNGQQVPQDQGYVDAITAVLPLWSSVCVDPSRFENGKERFRSCAFILPRSAIGCCLSLLIIVGGGKEKWHHINMVLEGSHKTPW